MRIAIGEFKHEVNTFSPVPTTLDVFRADRILEGPEMLRVLAHTNTEIWGFVEQMAAYPGQVVPLVAANALSGGPLTAETYTYLRDRLLDHLRQAGPVDGLFLALHGATVADVEGGDDVTGLLLREVRKLTGPALPIIATLDLHANVTRQMIDQATALIGYQTWPHIDLADRGREAANLLWATLAGIVRPAMALAKLPMILQVENGQTTSGPMAELLGRVRSWEREGCCLCGSVFLVQPWMDLPEMGCAVTIVTNDDKTHAQILADRLAADMWQRRHDFGVELTSVDAAIDQALQASGKPVVLADSADSTGSGAPGDSTAILARLLDRHVTCRVLLPIVDKEAVQVAFEAGQGATVRLGLGGKIDSLYSRPVTVEGEVVRVGEATFRFKGPVFTGQELAMGPVAVLRVRNIFILVSQRPNWTVDPEMYRSVGLEPTEAQIVVVKSPNQFRAGYGPIAHQILVVDAPGRASANLRSLPFRRLPRPFYPFDQDWPGAPFEVLNPGMRRTQSRI